jgi:hypothetical protein
VNRRGLLAGITAVVGSVALLVAGYAATGPTGLIDAATVAAAGVLVMARSTVQEQEPPSVRPRKWRKRAQAPTVSTAEFPGYRKISSDLSWGLKSRRQYEHGVRPMLARLAAALDRPDVAHVTGPSTPDVDGPGVDRATLERIVTGLEEDK